MHVGPSQLQRVSGPIGLDGTLRLDERSDGPLVATRARWHGDRNLSIESRWVVEGSVFKLSLRFDDEAKTVHVTFGSNRGRSGEFIGVARGD